MFIVTQEGGEAGTIITLCSRRDALSEKLYIYVYTHIHIYCIYIYTSHYMLSENPAVKKYRPFYNNSTIDFYYNTQ